MSSTSKRKVLYVDETMLTEGGYVPSLVVEDEPGHSPMTGDDPHQRPWFFSHDLTTAKKLAADYNAGLGLTEDDVTDIVMSSMRASNLR